MLNTSLHLQAVFGDKDTHCMSTRWSKQNIFAEDIAYLSAKQGLKVGLCATQVQSDQDAGII